MSHYLRQKIENKGGLKEEMWRKKPRIMI